MEKGKKMRKQIKCFGAYDVRGKLGSEIDEDVVYRIAIAAVQHLQANLVVVAHDARHTSPLLAQFVIKGIRDAGANVLDIGLAGTEEMYWAVSEFCADAGIVVTASHNPIDYNGMKIIKSGSEPLSENEFSEVKSLAEGGEFFLSKNSGLVFDKQNNARQAYIVKLLSFVNFKSLKSFKIVINSGNGAAGQTVDELQKALEIRGISTNFVKVHHSPDPTFPNGIPNPLIEENRVSTAEAIKNKKADFGVAFDGDFDRCFLFDNLGHFIPGEYIVGLLAEFFLRKDKGANIVHDPRVIWNTTDIVKMSGGQSVASKTGHAFIKRAMRQVSAVYGGEMSAHHYFREFAYCDSGMIPWLIIWELLSEENISLAEIVNERRKLFPSSGEINFTVSDTSNCMMRVKEVFLSKAISIDEIDGLSLSFENWRFNLRQSNTEPLVRLNVETRGDAQLLQDKTTELTRLIKEY